MDAVRQAIESPLLDTDISTAGHILLNTSEHINIMELNEVITYIREITSPEVDIMWGTVSNSDAPDEVVVTLIATGLIEKSSSAKISALGITPAYQGKSAGSPSSGMAQSSVRTTPASRNPGRLSVPSFLSGSNTSGQPETVIPEFIKKYSPVPKKKT